jgi:hypothetical protein
MFVLTVAENAPRCAPKQRRIPPIMALTDAELRNLTEPGKHFDGAGFIWN